MGFQLSSKDYSDYIVIAFNKIHENGDYVTDLDSATGDGDHWSNINMGFEKLVEIKDELSSLSLADSFKKIGMTMMSVIGGSSGVLYGSAYVAASKVLKDKDAIGNHELCDILEAMVTAIMTRGNAKPGMKTMIDCLYPAVECYKECIAKGISEEETLKKVKEAAALGANSTADMEAIRGRAFYQANKGVGHLDPGAITMSYQIETLVDFVLSKI